MLSGARLREERGEATIVCRRRILRQATIGLERKISKTRLGCGVTYAEAVFESIQLP